MKCVIVEDLEEVIEHIDVMSSICSVTAESSNINPDACAVLSFTAIYLKGIYDTLSDWYLKYFADFKELEERVQWPEWAEEAARKAGDADV